MRASWDSSEAVATHRSRVGANRPAGDAESTHALTATEELQGGELAPAVIVYERDSGLTPADFAKIREDVAKLTVPDRATIAITAWTPWA